MRTFVKVIASALLATMLVVAPSSAGAVTGPPGGLASSGEGATWQLSWDPVPGASAYRVDVSTSAGFTTLLETTNTYARSHTPRVDLRTALGRTVYWRVAAYSSGTSASTLSPYSETATLDVGALDTPALTSPGSGETVAYPDPVTFAWDPVPGAVSYELEYTGPSGTPETVTVTTNAFSPTKTLTRGDYAWRVRATTASSSVETSRSSWSAPGEFTVVWRDSDSRVKLLSPVTILPAVSDPEFRWEAVPGAAFYKIAIYGDEAKTNVFQAPVEVYGTSYVPEKVMLNGPYFWEVTAYDTAGIAGAPQTSLTQVTKRWGAQAAATQPGTENLDAAPEPLVGGSLSAPEPVPFDELELSWEPIPRATFYRVVASPLGGGDVWVCTTASTSVTGSMFYAVGDQLQTHSNGSSHCRGASNNANRLILGKTYMWQVQGVDYNGAQTTAITAGMPAGTLVSGLSEPRYVTVVEPVKAPAVGTDCTEATPFGGCVDLDEAAFLGQEGMTLSSSGLPEFNSPAPRLEWAPLAGAVGYEVRFYRGAGTTTHVATFRTAQTVLRPNGVFKDDNTGEPYSFRVRAIMSGNLATGAGLTYPIEPTWDQTEHLEWQHTSAAAEFEDEHDQDREGAVLLRWRPQFSVDPGFGGNRGYQVSYAVASSGAWKSVKVEYPFWVVNENKAPMPAGTYDVRVAPLDANGDVGRSTQVRQFTVAPMTPPSVTATAVGPQSVALTWAPSNVAEGYQVRWKRSDSSTWTTVTSGTTLTTTQTGYVVPGLRPAEYDFGIRARTKGNNWSAWSDDVTATVAPAQVRPLGSDGDKLDGSNRIVAWEPVDGASRYAVQMATTEAGVEAASTTEVVGTQMSIPNDLVWATRYHWRVTALAEPKLNTSAPTPTFTNRIALGSSPVRSFFARTRPAVPQLSATINAVAADALSLSWTELTGVAAGSDLAPTYVLRYRKTNRVPEDAWTELEVNSATSTTVSGLTSATEYEFQLSARNTEGQSAWTGSRKKSTPTPPSSPRSLKAVNVKAQRLDLQWSAPSSNGGAEVTGYQVRWKPSTDAAWSSMTVTTSPATVTGLRAATRYDLEVRALNDAGESAPATAGATTASLPGAPLKLAAKPGKGSVVLTWAPPTSDGGSRLTGYEVWARPTDGVWSLVGEPTTTTFTHSGLSNGRSYEYRVAAVTAAGAGDPSRAVTQVVGIPGKPRVTVKAKKGAFVVKGAGGQANGAPITSYTLQVSTDKKTWRTIRKTKKSVRYTKGKKGKTFYFRAIAHNKFGASLPSAVKAARKK